MLHVVGGTYLERCLFPEWNALYGSGLRASIAAKRLGADVTFHTLVGHDDLATLKAHGLEAQIEIYPQGISQTIRFDYIHGLSAPTIYPPTHLRQRAEPLRIKADAILQFGFIEGDSIVNGQKVVFDPQNPHCPKGFLESGSTAEHLAIVCNRTEGRLITGESAPERIAEVLLQQESAAVVAVKCGSHGCLVAEHGRITHIPAFKTKNVWPIGSGDTFAAAFAKAWAVDGCRAAEAAEAASKATAHYCETMCLDFPNGFFESFSNEPCLPKESAFPRKVYLAGPFFSMSQIWLIEQAYEALLGQHLEIFSPLHHVGRGSAEEVYGKDMAGLEECDVVFACIDGLDPGTIYEIGYAKALNKPVIAFVQDEKPEDLKLLEGSGCHLERDFVTAIYRTYWVATA